MRQNGVKPSSARERTTALIGLIISVATLAFIVREFIRTDALSLVDWSRPQVWIAFAGGAGGYAVVSVLVALGWCVLLKGLGSRTPSVQAFAVHATFQVLKYLPLNVLHQFGRAVGMKARGTSIVQTVMASLGEAALAAGAGLLIALPLLIQIFDSLFSFSGIVILGGIAGLATVVAVLLLFRERILIRLDELSLSLRNVAISATVAFALYCVFFIMYGALSGWIAGALSLEPLELPVWPVIGALSASWVIGFVTPGAAAGLGVREAALLIVLGPITGPAPALLIALSSRIINIGGDAMLALAGLIWLKALPRVE
jgi:glycosyltransferase 2 family protein